MEERCSAGDRGDFLNHSLSEDLLNRHVCDTFGHLVGETRGRACQTSWAVFNQTVALKCMPNVNAFLLDIRTDLLPLGLFLFLGLLLISHPRMRTDRHRTPEGSTGGKRAIYVEHSLMHSFHY